MKTTGSGLAGLQRISPVMVTVTKFNGSVNIGMQIPSLIFISIEQHSCCYSSSIIIIVIIMLVCSVHMFVYLFIICVVFCIRAYFVTSPWLLSSASK
jgi:hypothetical protein